MPYIGRTLGQGTRSRFLYTATAGQTTFSGSDSQSNTLAYADNNGLDCFQNGVLLKGGGADYTATTGTSVVLTTGASVSDVIEILVYDVFAIADHVKKSGDTMTGVLNLDVSGSGTALNVQLDSSTVGGLGAISDRVYLEAEGSHSVYLDASENNFNPGSATGTDNDNNINLGASFARWKDLYLGGGLYVGGTGSANKLDDYEEGTWTPSIDAESTSPSVSYGDRTGKYTKIGNMVTVYADIQPSISGGSSNALITGLPFSVTSSDIRPTGVMEGRNINLSSGYTFFYVFSFANNDKLYIRQSGDNVTETGVAIGNIGTRIGFTFTYMTDA